MVASAEKSNIEGVDTGQVRGQRKRKHNAGFNWFIGDGFIEKW